MDRFEEDLQPVRWLSNLYLHSSMDRFEDSQPYALHSAVNDLHSSMDRFEGTKAHLPTTQTLQNLHSSMDRFEVLILKHAIAPIEAFTFQYG